jgi:anti-sigma regulatory factor (Ser/Thr protein kinase)
MPRQSLLMNWASFYIVTDTKVIIPIIAFPGSNSDSATARRDLVISSIGNLITTSLSLSLEARTAIMMLISELTDNIGDHADADSGFLLAQHYPLNGYLDICIADCGIGILRSFQKIKPDITTSGEAINRAVRGESTKGMGRGYGISGSINMLGSIGGEFILLSGDSSFVKRINSSGATVDTANHASWPGCSVLIRIPTTMPQNFSIYQYYS